MPITEVTELGENNTLPPTYIDFETERPPCIVTDAIDNDEASVVDNEVIEETDKVPGSVIIEFGLEIESGVIVTNRILDIIVIILVLKNLQLKKN